MFAASLIILSTSLSPSPSWGHASAIDVSSAASGCEHCHEGFEGPTRKHWFPDPLDETHQFTCEGTDGNGCHSTKNTYFCNVVHNACNIETLALGEAIEAELEIANFSGIANLIRSNAAATYNAHRAAIQVMDCMGGVAFTLHVDLTLAEDLATEFADQVTEAPLRRP